jgi:hypothetical protein
MVTMCRGGIFDTVEGSNVGDNNMKTKFFAALLAWMFLSTCVYAVPTLQVYIDGATAGTNGADVDTWFTGSSSFDLILVGAYGPQTGSIDYATLVASVPQGQTGSITVNGATLLTLQGTNGPGNPATDADIDVLTNVSGIDGYSDKSFAPDTFDNHYPFQNDVSDFVLYDVGSFSKSTQVHDYDADSGSITLTNTLGEEKTFAVDVSGFDSVHFDMYAYETDLLGGSSKKAQKYLVNTWDWEINPGSHDSTFGTPMVPAPGALLLASIGAGFVGWLRKSRAL